MDKNDQYVFVTIGDKRVYLGKNLDALEMAKAMTKIQKEVKQNEV